MQLFKRVLHALEGEEIEHLKGTHKSGRPLAIERRTFGPDRWIEAVWSDGAASADEFLALVLFVQGGIGRLSARKQEPMRAMRAVVESWAAKLTEAMQAGEVLARDPLTLLQLSSKPDGFAWALTLADADRLLKSNGIDWTCAEVAEHLRKQCRDGGRDSYTWADSGEPANIFDNPVQASPEPVSAGVATMSEPVRTGAEPGNNLDNPAPANPPPLTTPDIADAFEGIEEQTAKQWRDKLGDVNNHQWVVTARAEKGRAPKPATWWPVAFAELLLARDASEESLNRAFITAPKLKPWLPLWQEKHRERNAFGQ